MSKKILSTLAALIIFTCIHADIWTLPEVRHYYSSDSTYCLTVFPTRFPAGRHKKKSEKEADSLASQCYAQMKRIEMNDTIILWEKRLINSIAPLFAIISDDGKNVITFNDWGLAEHGINAMVIYDGEGTFKKRYTLKEISPFPVNSYSSIWWFSDVGYLDNQRVEFGFKDKDGNRKERIYNTETLEFEF